jgi:hypothetical protein
MKLLPPLVCNRTAICTDVQWAALHWRAQLVPADKVKNYTLAILVRRHLVAFTRSQPLRRWRASYETRLLGAARCSSEASVADVANAAGTGLMVIWAWGRALFAFRRTGRQAVYLIDQLARGLNTVLQAFVLRASYIDVGIAPTILEPCAISSAHH